MLEHLPKHSVGTPIFILRNFTLTHKLTFSFQHRTGIGPETFAWISPDGNFTGGPDPAPSDLAFYAEHGFYIFNGGSDYILRPEVLESNFYAWRVTGDEKYQQRALAADRAFGCDALEAPPPRTDAVALRKRLQRHESDIVAIARIAGTRIAEPDEEQHGLGLAPDAANTASGSRA